MRNRFEHAQPTHIKRGILVGMVAGFVGALAMTLFQGAVSKAGKALKQDREDRDQQDSGGNNEERESDDATMKAANGLAKAVLGRELSHEEKQKAGPFVHYSFGTITGGLYGALAEVASPVTLGQGLGFSTALWAIGDEIAVPALGLSGPAQESPLSSHAYAWASHLVYGFIMEWTRRGVIRLLGDERGGATSFENPQLGRFLRYQDYKRAA